MIHRRFDGLRARCEEFVDIRRDRVVELLLADGLDLGAVGGVLEGALALIGLSISTAVRERIQQVGFVMVLLLMVFVITNDVVKTFSGPSEPEKPAATAPAK